MGHWDDVQQRIETLIGIDNAAGINWVGGASYGGFGRMNQAYRTFFRELDEIAGIPFDPVYTGKLAMRIAEYLQQEEVRWRKPLLLHTGGLQGRRSIMP